MSVDPSSIIYTAPTGDDIRDYSAWCRQAAQAGCRLGDVRINSHYPAGYAMVNSRPYILSRQPDTNHVVARTATLNQVYPVALHMDHLPHRADGLDNRRYRQVCLEAWVRYARRWAVQAHAIAGWSGKDICGYVRTTSGLFAIRLDARNTFLWVHPNQQRP